ncbi:MAG: 4Fe-4S cluster-binding domain-containing protein [Zhenhengia sp.]
MIEGVINKIIPFSSVDGPGNRTAIFLQGCNFNCIYCHNPETIQVCTGCGRCVGSCPKDALYQAEATIVGKKIDVVNVTHVPLYVKRVVVLVQ